MENHWQFHWILPINLMHEKCNFIYAQKDVKDVGSTSFVRGQGRVSEKIEIIRSPRRNTCQNQSSKTVRHMEGRSTTIRHTSTLIHRLAKLFSLSLLYVTVFS